MNKTAKLTVINTHLVYSHRCKAPRKSY